MRKDVKNLRGVESARAKIILYKCAFYGAALFIIGVLQTTFFTKINVWGATPDLLLAALAALALYEDGRVVSICGIISGVFYCALGGFSIPFYIIFSFLSAYALYIVAENGVPKRHFSFFALAILAFGAKAIFNLADISLAAHSFGVIKATTNIIIPEFVSSMIFSPISYLIFFTLTRIINKK